MKKYYYLSITTLSIIFVTGISLVFAQSWQAPSGPPPGNNTSPSINVSDLTQTKAGNLWAAHLSSENDVYANQSILAPGTIESTDNTKILTIDSNAGGQFEWREADVWARGGGGPPPVGGYERIMGTPGNPSIAACSAGKRVIGGGCGPVNPDDLNGGWGFPETDTTWRCLCYDCPNIVAYAICVEGL